MRNILDYFSYKLSLTAQEIKSAIFLITILFLGLFVKFTSLKLSGRTVDNNEVIFFKNLEKEIEIQQNSAVEQNKIIEKRVDSDLELSDFSVEKFDFNKKLDKNLKLKSIDLNSASVSELTKLPGIGQKTAEKIVEFRQQPNGFKVIEDLLKVKGIGNKKFNTIKKYLYIEK